MYDVMIIGGGISGGSAAIYTAYGEMETAVVDAGKSQLKPISKILNYPGIKDTNGQDLLTAIQKQAVSFGAKWISDEVIKLEAKDGRFIATLKNGGQLESLYAVIATNLNINFLTDLGLEISVNEKVPSGKIKKVSGLRRAGKTAVPGLYVTGLLAGIPSQSIIAAGHGAEVGVAIVSEKTGKVFMWHDK